VAENEGLADRVEHLESGQDRILSRLDELLGTGGIHKKAAAAEERRLDRPATIEEQVRMELERKEREDGERKDRESEKSERQSMRETLAKLTEAKPEQPQPRRQRVMWGKR
jgi:hypothetical protein